MRPLVEFVSKPIVEPFQDGSKCLVRDLAWHCTRVEPAVFGTEQGLPAWEGRVRIQPVYRSGGGFAPSLRQNMRAASWLLLRSRASVWHFVFAPNLNSSRVGRSLRKLRRVPVVQTIASPPRSFEHPEQLLFGDRVVAQSRWTREQFLLHWQGPTEPPPLSFLPPPAPQVQPVSPLDCQRVRARLQIPDGVPLFVFPGDLEEGRGMREVAALIQASRDYLPEARWVIAYRTKSVRAEEQAAAWQAQLAGERVRFEKNLPDIHALLAAATAVVFPVRDLYGKVDLPIVLLEALTFGTPVFTLDEGPLASLAGALHLPADPSAWEEPLRQSVENRSFRGERAEAGRLALESTFSAARVTAAYEDLYFELIEDGFARTRK